MLALCKRLFRPPEEASSIYFYELDLARGLAACAILVWHYQHFIALGMAPAGSRGNYPFYSVLRLLYEQGGAAVQLFWIISGFVFSAVYWRTSASTWQFFVNRFGRLYPLHALTLLAVAALQVANIAVFGHALIYPSNSLHDFCLQVFMASGWTTPVSFSFNGPVWSVSAEILIYALFWILLSRLFRWGVAGPIAVALACLALSFSPLLATVWLCGFYFFIGCAIFVCNRALHDQPVLRIGLGIAAIIFSIAVIHFASQGAGSLILFVGAVLLLTSLNRWSSHRLDQRLGWLGDSTYGIYLWHIPIQLALLLGLQAAGISRSVALTEGFFVLYVVLVLTIARFSFTHFERPMRGYIRSKSAGWSRDGAR